MSTFDLEAFRRKNAERNDWMSDLDLGEEKSKGYVGGLDPENLTANSEFMADLRGWYSDRGIDGTDEELIERWYEDRNFRDINTLYVAKDAADAYAASPETRERDARLIEGWRSLPDFWQEGGRGFGALGDIGYAIITDPLNYIPFGGPAASTAIKGSLRASLASGSALSKPAVRRAAWSGVRAGLPREIAANAAIGGGASLAEQHRDKSLGLREDISLTQAGQAAALTGAAGAALSGPLTALNSSQEASRLAGEFTEEAFQRVAREAAPRSIPDEDVGDIDPDIQPIDEWLAELEADRVNARESGNADKLAAIDEQITKLEQARTLPSLVQKNKARLEEIDRIRKGEVEGESYDSKIVEEELQLRKTIRSQEDLLSNLKEETTADGALRSLDGVNGGPDFDLAPGVDGAPTVRGVEGSSPEIGVSGAPETQTDIGDLRPGIVSATRQTEDGLTRVEEAIERARQANPEESPEIDETSVFDDQGELRDDLRGTEFDPDYVQALRDEGILDPPDLDSFSEGEVVAALANLRARAGNDQAAKNVLANTDPQFENIAPELLSFDRQITDYDENIIDLIEKSLAEGRVVDEDAALQRANTRDSETAKELRDIAEELSADLEKDDKKLFDGIADRIIAKTDGLEITTKGGARLSLPVKMKLAGARNTLEGVVGAIKRGDYEKKPRDLEAQRGTPDGDEALTEGAAGRTLGDEFTQGVPGTEGAGRRDFRQPGPIQSILQPSNKHGFFGRDVGRVVEYDETTGQMVEVAADDAEAVGTASRQMELSNMELRGIENVTSRILKKGKNKGKITFDRESLLKASDARKAIGQDKTGKRYLKGVLSDQEYIARAADNTLGAEESVVRLEPGQPEKTRSRRRRELVRKYNDVVRLTNEADQSPQWKNARLALINQRLVASMSDIEEAYLENLGRVVAPKKKSESKSKTKVRSGEEQANAAEDLKKVEAQIKEQSEKISAERAAAEQAVLEVLDGSNYRRLKDTAKINSLFEELEEAVLKKTKKGSSARELALLRLRLEKEGRIAEFTARNYVSEARTSAVREAELKYSKASDEIMNEEADEAIRKLRMEELTDQHNLNLEIIADESFEAGTMRNLGYSDKFALRERARREYTEARSVVDADPNISYEQKRILHRLLKAERDELIEYADYSTNPYSERNNIRDTEDRLNRIESMLSDITTLVKDRKVVPEQATDLISSLKRELPGDDLPQPWLTDVDPRIHVPFDEPAALTIEDLDARFGDQIPDVQPRQVAEGLPADHTYVVVAKKGTKTREKWSSFKGGKPWRVGSVYDEGAQSLESIVKDWPREDLEVLVAPIVRTENGKLDRWNTVRGAQSQNITPPPTVARDTVDKTRMSKEDRAVFDEIFRAENVEWEALPDTESHRAHVRKLKDLYAKAPEITLPTQDREAAYRQIEDIFAGADAEVLMVMKDVVRRLGSEQAPILKGVKGNPGMISNNVIKLNPKKATYLEDFIHEIAHWSYDNILSTEDRMSFWAMTEKFYDQNGQFNQGRVNKNLVTVGDDGVPISGSNSNKSAQEYFANQFVQWSLSNGKVAGDQNFWRRVVGYFDQLFKHFFGSQKLVDQNLTRMFSKILPDRKSIALLDVEKAMPPKTAAGSAIADSIGQTQNMIRGIELLNDQWMNTPMVQGDDYRRMMQHHIRFLADVTKSPQVNPKLQDDVTRVIDMVRDVNAPTGMSALMRSHEVSRVLYDVDKQLRTAYEEIEGSKAVSIDELFPEGLRSLPEKTGNVVATLASSYQKTAAKLSELENSFERVVRGESESVDDVFELSMRMLMHLGNLKVLHGKGKYHDPVFQNLLLSKSKGIYDLLGIKSDEAALKGTATPETISDAAVYLRGKFADMTIEDRMALLEDEFSQISGLLRRGVRKHEQHLRRLSRSHAARIVDDSGAPKKRKRKAHNFKQYNDLKKRQAETEAAVLAEATNKLRADAGLAPMKGLKQDGRKLAQLTDEELEYDIVNGVANGDDQSFGKARYALNELEGRIKGSWTKPAATKISKEIMYAGTRDLRKMLGNAIVKSDKDRINEITLEMWMRGNRDKTKGGLVTLRKENQMQLWSKGIRENSREPLVAVENPLIKEAVRREADEFLGELDDEFIPERVQGDIREAARFLTHRDPEVTRDMQTMFFRLTKLMGKGVRNVLDEVQILDIDDLARLTGNELKGTERGGVIDLRGEHFTKLRKDLRGIAMGLRKGGTSPYDVAHEIGHVLLRTNLYDDTERSLILDAYRSSDDTIAKAVRKRYGSEGDIRSEAEEWFSEGMAQYLSERVARGDAWDANAQTISGNWSTQLKSQLEVLLDRLVEGFAYLTNRMLGRTDMRQLFRKATFYGDMRSLYAPSSEPVLRYSDVRPQQIIDYEDAVARKRGDSKESHDAINEYTNGFDYNGGDELVVYHATPHGLHFDPDLNPEVVMVPSRNGVQGPGIYLGENRELVDWQFGQLSTDESLAKIRNTELYPNLSESQRAQAYAIASDTRDMRMEITDLTNMLRGNTDDLRAETSYLKRAEYDENRDIRRSQILEDIQVGRDRIAQNDEYLSSVFGVERTVLPLYMGIRNPLDLTKGVDMTSPKARDIVEALVQNKHTTYEDVSAALRSEGYSTKADLRAVDGHSFHSALATSINAGEPELGLITVNQTLRELGYDSLKAHDYNRNASGQYEQHPVWVVFDPENVKHINAESFDKNDNRLFFSDIQPEHINGAILNAAQRGNGKLDTTQMISSLGELTRAGVDPAVVSTMMDISKGKITTRAVETLQKFNPIRWLRGSVSAVRQDTNAVWFADLVQPKDGTGIVEDLNVARGKKLNELLDLVRSTVGDGAVTDWAKFVMTGGKPRQNRRVSNVVKALRTEDISKLDPDQKKLYDGVNKLFADELEYLRQSGSAVFSVKGNYFPQVWKPEAIRQKPGEFIAAVSRYFVREHELDGNKLSWDDAVRKAEVVTENLLSNEGVWSPPRAERKSSNFSSMDHQRLFKLHQQNKRGGLLFRDNIDELDEFLDDNLMSVVTKYVDEAALRAESTKRFGWNNHGFYDYMHVATAGRQGAIDLLTSDKIEYRRYREVSEAVPRVEQEKNIRIKGMDDDFMAGKIVDEAIRLIQANADNVPLGRQKAIDMIRRNRKGSPSKDFDKRAEAVVNGLIDFGPTPSLSRSQLGAIEGTFRRMIRKPHTIDAAFSDASYEASRFMKMFNNVSLLGFTTLTSISDIALPLVRSGSLKSTGAGWKNYLSDPDYRQAIKNVGLSVNRIVSKYTSQTYGEPATHIDQAFFEGTFLSQWTAIQREIAGAVGYEQFKAAQRKLQAAHASGQDIDRRALRTQSRFLNHYGLGDYARPGAPSLGDTNVLSNSQVAAALNKFANESIFEPNFADKPLWAQGPLGSIIFQLKSYPLMFQKLSVDVIKEAKDGNVAPLFYLLTAGTGAGSLALVTKDIVQSRGGDDQESRAIRQRSFNDIIDRFGFDPVLHGSRDEFAGLMLEGFMAAGGLGLIASSLYDSAQQIDNGAYGFQRTMGVIFGPTVGVMNDAYNVTAGVVNAATEGGDDGNSKERQAVRAMMRRIPVVGGVRGTTEDLTDYFAGEPVTRTGSWGNQWRSRWN